jgi:hypothetical protein
MSHTVKKCLLISIVMFADCVKPYNPPALQAKNNYLVVDGYINPEAGQATTITLSRTRNLSDSAVADEPELNGSLQIVSSDGEVYPLTEKGNGVYQSAALTLDNTKTYQLKITTSDGKRYNSDYLPCKTTPPIDSLTWEQPGDLIFYLYTHDPANNTHYYKWDYVETWQFNSPLTTPYGVADGLIYVKTKAQQTDSCWQNQSSATIIIGSSINLSQDVIGQAKIATVAQNNAKLFVRYSILVKQRAISAEAYNYWQIVEKNSQNRGTFFDLQPGQLVGNIHSETDLTEPVIGFINCSSEKESRLIISHTELHDWLIPEPGCKTREIPVNQNNYLIYDYPDTNYAPYSFITNGPLVIAPKTCLDCTTHGGTNERPPYW